MKENRREPYQREERESRLDFKETVAVGRLGKVEGGARAWILVETCVSKIIAKKIRAGAVIENQHFNGLRRRCDELKALKSAEPPRRACKQSKKHE